MKGGRLIKYFFLLVVVIALTACDLFSKRPDKTEISAVLEDWGTAMSSVRSAEASETHQTSRNESGSVEISKPLSFPGEGTQKITDFPGDKVTLNGVLTYTWSSATKAVISGKITCVGNTVLSVEFMQIQLDGSTHSGQLRINDEYTLTW